MAIDPLSNELTSSKDGTYTIESYLRAINQFALSLIEITTVDDLVWFVAEEVVGKLDFVDCVIYLYDPQKDALIQSAAIGEKSPEKHIIVNKMEIPLGKGITGTVAQTMQPLIISDTSEDERYLEDLSEFRSEICLPMIYEGKLIGVIDSEHPEDNYFNQQHIEILTTIAALTSGKIMQCRTQNRIKAQASILDQVSEAVLVVREDGIIIDCNASSENLLNQPSNKLIGANASSLLVSSTDFEKLVDDVDQSIKATGLWSGRLGIKGVDQNDITTEVSVTKLIDENIDEELYISVTRDISEQVKQERLERELQQAQKMESLGHLTGGIAHDFNNLLGIITGYSDLAYQLSNKYGNNKVNHYISQIQDASRRAANLVSQMLSFSRSAPEENKPIVLADVVQGDANMLRASLPSSIELSVVAEQGLPPVKIDPTRVHQLLMNICVNARDAMSGEGKIKINLNWKRNLNTISPISHRPVRGDWIELSVRDSGTGIDKANISKIFNPFFTTKDIGQGTGMGLSVVYKIMDEHGGHILIDSLMGVGTTIRLLFQPSKEEVSKNDELNEESCHVDNKVTPKSAHIMVVDDEESLGLLIAKVLQENGYSATPISDSQKAFDLFQQNPDMYSLVISDQTMPKMTGIDLISLMRGVEPSLPVILCTGYSDKVDASVARELNIPYFDKPIDMEKLLATVSMLLNQ